MENLTEQEIVRRGKLEKYKELGIDPFGQKYDVTHHSIEIKQENNIQALDNKKKEILNCLYYKFEV